MNRIKQIFLNISLSIALLFSSMTLLAQEAEKTQVDINVDKDGGSTWYAQPWVWVVGAAIFILLLVALLRSNKKD